MQVTKSNANVVKGLIEAVLDTRFQFRTAETVENLTGFFAADLIGFADDLGLDTSKKRRRDGATLIGLGNADRMELRTLREIIIALDDVRYTLRSAASITNKLGNVSAEAVEIVADQFGFTVKHRNSDGAALIGFGE